MSSRRQLILYFVIALAPLLPSATFGQGSAKGSANLDGQIVKSTVESLTEVIRREYVDPDLAAQVDALLRQELAEGTFTGITTPDALATKLTSDLFAATHDKHLAVTVVPESADGSTPTAATDESRERKRAALQLRHQASGNTPGQHRIPQPHRILPNQRGQRCLFGGDAYSHSR
jgi:hypothetical protein